MARNWSGATLPAKELADLYKVSDKPDLKKLLFAIHTYYVLLMKMLAAELVSLQEGSWFSSFTSDIEAASDDLLKSKVENLENGGLFQTVQYRQLPRGRLFSLVSSMFGIQPLRKNLRHLALALPAIRASHRYH